MTTCDNARSSSIQFSLVVATVVAATHLYSLFAFGPVFWVDTVVYVNLAESMRTGTLGNFYADVGSWFYAHVQPGLPLVWLTAAATFPPAARWFAIAAFQHTVAAAVLWDCAVTLNRYWPTRLQVVAVLLLCLLPFYQALHNAILTESLSSSLLLLAFTLSVQLCREPTWKRGAYAGLLACLLVATQFRSYLGVLIALLACVALYAHRERLTRRALVLVLIAALAVIAFPLYRYALTGSALLPSTGVNALVTALWYNVSPGEATRRALEDADLPASIPIERVLSKGIDFPEAATIARHWKDLGLDADAVNRRAARLRTTILNESPATLVNRVLAGLESSGVIGGYAWVPREKEVFRGYDARRMFEHAKRNYRYLSWVQGVVLDDSERVALFDAFFSQPPEWDNFSAQRISKQLLIDDMRAGVQVNRALPADLLRLGRLPPDFWFGLGLAALISLTWAREYAVAISASLLIVANFAISFAVPIANTRYAYPLFPLYFLLVPVAAIALRRRTATANLEKGSRGYFYELLSQYLSLRIRPDDRMVEIEPATDRLLKQYPQGRAAFRDPTRRSAAGWDGSSALTFDQIAGYTPDYVLMSGLVHYERDVQTLFESVGNAMPENARLIVVYYSSLWRPLLRLGSRLGWRRTTIEPNWLAHPDIENLLRLADFEPITCEAKILVPLRVPLLSAFVNRWLAPLPVFRLFALANVLCARRVPRDVAPGQRSVSIIVPARNEAGNIRAIVQRIPRMGPDDELIFVEGHSKDATWNVIEDIRISYSGPLRIRSARQPGNGKGDAVRCGFNLAEREILMILDADMTVPPEDLRKFYDAIVNNKGEFLNGSRLVYPMERRAMRFMNILANKFFATAFSFVLGQRFKDTLCGTKVLTRSNYLKLASNRAFFGEFDPFGDFDLIFGASRMGLKIVEIPIHYRERIYGETNIARWRHGAVLLGMLIFAARRVKFQ